MDDADTAIGKVLVQPAGVNQERAASLADLTDLADLADLAGLAGLTGIRADN